MECMFCGCTKTEVKDTAKLPNKIIRRRKCTKCQETFCTEEKAPAVDTVLRAELNKYKQSGVTPADPTANKKVIFVYAGYTERAKVKKVQEVWDELTKLGITANKARGRYIINTKHLIIQFFSSRDEIRGKKCDEAFDFDPIIREQIMHLPPQGFAGDLIEYITLEENKK